MVDSANDAVAQLKAELSDMRAEAEDARRAAEEAEAALAAAVDGSTEEARSLRTEIAAGGCQGTLGDWPRMQCWVEVFHQLGRIDG